jgi:hypothetical protein
MQESRDIYLKKNRGDTKILQFSIYGFKRWNNQKLQNLKQALTLSSKEIQKVIKEKEVKTTEYIHLASEETREVENVD